MTGTEVIRATQDDGSNHSTFAVPFKSGASAAVGDKLIVCLNAPSAAGAITNFSAVDSKGNTWNQRAFVIGTNGNSQVGVLTCDVATAMSQAGGDTITITANTRSPLIWSVLGAKFDDLVIPSAFDATASGTNPVTVANSAVGVTAGSGAQNQELEFACAGWASAGATLSLSGSWDGTPALLFNTGTNAATPKMIQMMWRYVNVSGARSWSGTLSQTITHADALVTMKQVVAAAKATHFKNQTTGLYVPSIRKRQVAGSWA